MARLYWVRRNDWEIGPVHERQFENMMTQRWFLETDEIRTSAHGNWLPAGQVVPRHAIRAELEDDSDVARETEARAEADDCSVRTPAPKDAPQWFQERRRRHAPRSSRRDRNHDDEQGDSQEDVFEDDQARDPRSARSQPVTDDFRFVTAEIDNREFLAQDRVRIHGGRREHEDDESDADARRGSERDDFDPSDSTAGRIRGRSRSGLEPSSDQDEAADQQDRSSRHRQRRGVKEPDNDVDDLEVEVFWDDDSFDGQQSPNTERHFRQQRREEPDSRGSKSRRRDDGDDSREDEHRPEGPRKQLRSEPVSQSSRQPTVAPDLPSEFELDVDAMRGDPEARVRKSIAPKKDDVWSHVDESIPGDDDSERRAAEAKREFKLKHTEPVDFAKAVQLAAHDPAASRPDLPVYEVEAPLMTDEERGIRKAIYEPYFLPLARAMLTTIGVQLCAMSVGVNAWCFLAFKRLFILGMEVFIPFGQGSGETLLETDLMFCGMAMACTAALPFLPLTYMLKMDGKVMPYLGTLGGAFFAALIFNRLVLQDAAGIALSVVFLCVPSLVTAGLAMTLGVKTPEKGSKQLLFGGWAAALMAGVAFAVSSPTFGFNNQVRHFPPFIEVFGLWSYLALIGYSAKLSLVYAVFYRWAKNLCDEATREFIVQHIVFHGLLSVVGLLALAGVQTGVLSGWASIPAALTAVTALVSQGFNFWSMASHVEPFLSRTK